MKSLLQKASKVVCDLAFATATLTANTTCNRYYYQEKLDDQVTALNRFHHE